MHHAGLSLLVICALALVGCGGSPLNNPPPPVQAGQPAAYNGVSPAVSIQIDSVTIRNLPYDALDLQGAQLQLFIFVSDGRGFQTRLDQFAGGYRSVDKGQYIGLGSTAVLFYEDWALDDVYVWFLAVDCDDIPTLLGGGNELIISQTLDTFTQEVATHGAQLLTESNVLTWLAAQGASLILSAWQVEDLIGQHAVLISRKEAWNQGTYRVVTEGGNMEIEYSIVYHPGNAGQPPASGGQVAQPGSVPSQSQVRSDCAGAPSSLFQVGDVAVVDFNHGGALRILRDYTGGASATIVQAYDNDRLQILGGPGCYNGKRYWRVLHENSGYRGWAADGEGSDRWMCTVSQPECGS